MVELIRIKQEKVISNISTLDCHQPETHVLRGGMGGHCQRELRYFVSCPPAPMNYVKLF